MMIHGRCGTQVWRPTLGIIKVTCEFFGKALTPRRGPGAACNALNAMIQLFVSLDQCASRSGPKARVHGVITRAASKPTSSPSTPRRNSICGRDEGVLQRAAATVRGLRRRRGHATGCTAKVTADRSFTTR
jgi:metal-dependent amidase/aminoacylase/carboxypeptidase family protein